ncbi:MAG: cysteine desulfurase [Ruminococcus sp.]|nr:cysteine desulfurase [Ruminococcus sp.]
MTVYLDNAATTKPCRKAVEAINEALTFNYGNPSSLHRMGLNAQLTVDSARKSVADALGCDASCIYFTSGATESNNLAVRGAASCYGKRKRRIIVSSVEHASVAETMNELESYGFEIVRVRPGAGGKFNPADFVNAANENTCLISMMLVNNETGHILPVKEVFTVLKRRYPDIVTHCDCVQGFMKIPVKASALNADMISLSGHKIHAVKGVGALYIRKGIRVKPLVSGGKQEKGIRSGTESVPLIAGFGAAVKQLTPTIGERFEYVKGLRSFLLEKLSGIDGVTLNSPADGSPYVINISAAGRRSEIMLHYLEQEEIYVSSGSACSKGAQSGVLAEFGVNQKDADSALRISMTADTTEEELEKFVLVLNEGIRKIKT